MVWSLRRGIRQEKHRPRSLKQGIIPLKAEKTLLVPLYGGEESRVRRVQPGEHVRRGEALTQPSPEVPVSFAPVSGRIVEFRAVELPLDGTAMCAVLEPDPEEQGDSKKKKDKRKELFSGEKRRKPQSPPEESRKETVEKAAEQMGIVDEFDGMPLQTLLENFRRGGGKVLVCCGLDDDPYGDSSGAVLREMPREAARGLQLAALACGAEKTLLAATSFYGWRKVRMAQTGVPVTSAGGRTPAKGLMARRLRQKKKKAGFIGAQACVALCRAVEEGVPALDTVITVSGDGVWRAGNFRVPLGMSLEEVLSRCALYPDVSLVYVGDALSGKAVTDLSLPVTARTRCVTVLRNPPVHREFSCIGCGRCTSVCVRGIYPWLVHDALNRDTVDPMVLWNVNRCTGCKACTAACPAGIDLAEEVARAAAIRKSGDFD